MQEFIPIAKGKVGLYTCGPTVYWYQHIGNFRTFLCEDVLRRYLEYSGYNVQHVMNITDVGHPTSDSDEGQDKMEKGAAREGKTVWEVAEFYTPIFLEDMKKLQIQTPTVICKATDHIQEQKDMIKELEKKGCTYSIADGIYFNSSKFPAYADFARLDVEGLKAGNREGMIEGKKNSADFALWKFSQKDSTRQME